MKQISILGGGNIGQALVKGFIKSGKIDPASLTLTRRKIKYLSELKDAGVHISGDNKKAVQESEIVILAVRPRQVPEILQEIAPVLRSSQMLVSVATAVSIREISSLTGNKIQVYRAMPNTAAAVGESVTALSSSGNDGHDLQQVKEVFDLVGKTYVIDEELMESAVVLNACGIAYFLRMIRAVMQGGIQIGFHAREAQVIAAQVARGAATLLLSSGNHPESEVDKVTTPRGVTIAGLNEMEHNGMSSALIKGITASFHEIEKLKNEKTVGEK